jgi:hypothetical protein
MERFSSAAALWVPRVVEDSMSKLMELTMEAV